MGNAFVNFYLIVVAFAVQRAYDAAFATSIKHSTPLYLRSDIWNFVAFVFFAATFVIWAQNVITRYYRKESATWLTVFSFLCVSIEGTWLIYISGLIRSLDMALVPIIHFLVFDIFVCFIFAVSARLGILSRKMYKAELLRNVSWVIFDLIAIALLAHATHNDGQIIQFMDWLAGSFILLITFLGVEAYTDSKQNPVNSNENDR
jgi:hypothetical protein